MNFAYIVKTGDVLDQNPRCGPVGTVALAWFDGYLKTVVREEVSHLRKCNDFVSPVIFE